MKTLMIVVVGLYTCLLLASLVFADAGAAKLAAERCSSCHSTDRICARLAAMDGRFSFVRPHGAFYVMAKAEFPTADGAVADSRELALRLIHEARVITIPGGAFGPGGEGHVRLSFGADEAEIETACDRLAAWASHV